MVHWAMAVADVQFVRSRNGLVQVFFGGSGSLQRIVGLREQAGQRCRKRAPGAMGVLGMNAGGGQFVHDITIEEQVNALVAGQMPPLRSEESRVGKGGR